MSCSDYSAAIAEFVDGSLDPAAQRDLERHAEGCEACRALVADLKSIQAAAFTLDRIELPAHVWESVRTHVATELVPETRGRVIGWPQSRSAWGAWAAVAAALLVATMAGIYPLLRSTDPHEGDSAAQSASTETRDVVASVQAELQ